MYKARWEDRHAPKLDWIQVGANLGVSRPRISGKLDTVDYPVMHVARTHKRF